MKLIQYLIVALKGFFMGAANVVPGVSGGTIALITGIYKDIIEALNSLMDPIPKRSRTYGVGKQRRPKRIVRVDAFGVFVLVFHIAATLSKAEFLYKTGFVGIDVVGIDALLVQIITLLFFRFCLLYVIIGVNLNQIH